MTFTLSSYLTALLLVAGAIIPASASKRDDSSDTDLDAWRAANNRTTLAQPCPQSCQDGDSCSDGFSSWFLFPDAANLATCNETMLLSFNVQETVIGGHQAPVTGIRGCKADYSFNSAQKNSPMSRDDVAAVCYTPNHDIVKASVTIGEPAGNNTSSGNNKASIDDILPAGHQVQNYIGTKTPSCTENVITFGYSRSAVVGLFAGAEVYPHGVHTDILSRLLQDLEKKKPIPDTQIVQLCPDYGHGADYAVGIVVAPVDGLTLVREVVRACADGRCVSANLESYMTVSLRVPSQIQVSNSTDSSSSSSSSP